jgi:hypothetical protein
MMELGLARSQMGLMTGTGAEEEEHDDMQLSHNISKPSPLSKRSESSAKVRQREREGCVG